VQGSYAQEISYNNFTGNWKDNITWTDGSSPGLNVDNLDVELYGYITLTGDASFNNGTLSIFDTLIVHGNFILNNNSELQIAPAGILIIYGDYTSENQAIVNSGGYLIVTGNFEMSGANNQGAFNNSGSLFILDITPAIKTGTGYTDLQCSDPEDFPVNCGYGNEEDILNDPISSLYLYSQCANGNYPLTLTPPENIVVMCRTELPPVYSTLSQFLDAGGILDSPIMTDTSSFKLSSETVSGNCPMVLSRIYSVSDFCGNSAVCTQTLTVKDTITPELILPPINPVACSNEVPDYYANYTALVNAGGSASDNCGLNIYSFAHISDIHEVSSCPEVITRTYSIFDYCGNQVTASLTITINDTVVPVLNLPDIPDVMCLVDIPAPYADYNALITSGGSAFDNCSVNQMSYTLSHEEMSLSGQGTMLKRTYRITDMCGNATLANQIISVLDNSPPILVCPSDTQLCAQNTYGIAVYGLEPSILSDNCSPQEAITCTYMVNGATDAIGKGNVSGRFFNIGVSTVTYTAMDESGNLVSSSFRVIVNPLPFTSELSGNLNPTCEEQNVLYAVSGAETSHFLWTIPTGAVFLTDTSQTGVLSVLLSYSTNGGKVTVTEISSSGCYGEIKTADIQLQECAVTADFEIDKPKACVKDTITITNTSSGVSENTTYRWIFGASAIPTNATGAGPHRIVYSSGGIKTISLTILEGSRESKTEKIVIAAKPQISLTGEDRCGDGEVIFTALTNTGTHVDFSIDGGRSILESDLSFPFSYTHVLREGDRIDVWARAVLEDHNCISEWTEMQSANAFTQPRTGLLSTESTNSYGYLDVVCSDQTRNYIVEGNDTSQYRWTIKELGMDQTGSNLFTILWEHPGGEYTLEVQQLAEGGCDGSISSGIILRAGPKPDLGPNREICDGDSALFEPDGNYSSFLWHDNTVRSFYYGQVSELVTLEVTDEYGCRGRDDCTLLVHDLPELDLGPDKVLCNDENLEIVVGHYLSYTWSNGATGNSATLSADDGNVVLSVLDYNGCTASDDITIFACTVEDLFEHIENVFTPNNDGVHDTWVIQNIEYFPAAEITVFDRYGKIVFHKSGGYENDWRGDFKGSTLPLDTYYYFIDCHANDLPALSGTITILY
jgi:gliding motility-associated-like protein